LWFGNQHAPGQENPVYGTARVLAAYLDVGPPKSPEARRGAAFLLDMQNPDGSWGGDRGVPGSTEETALAVDALGRYCGTRSVGQRPGESVEDKKAEAGDSRARIADEGRHSHSALAAGRSQDRVLQQRLMRRDDDPRIAEAVRRGCRYLVDRMARGALDEPNPIGLYFASLWYSEKLYPTIWTVAALGRVIAHCAASPARSRQRR
ncbi:MAG: hypothetical protein QGI33_02915, partial [Candidatus Brocadiia bacterium]|nr:hypothetical protein [Candidatus Brocadiia bacterium]